MVAPFVARKGHHEMRQNVAFSDSQTGFSENKRKEILLPIIALSLVPLSGSNFCLDATYFSEKREAKVCTYMYICITGVLFY